MGGKFARALYCRRTYNSLHYSCDIEDFVESHLLKLRVILRSSSLLGCVVTKDTYQRTAHHTMECTGSSNVLLWKLQEPKRLGR